MILLTNNINEIDAPISKQFIIRLEYIANLVDDKSWS